MAFSGTISQTVFDTRKAIERAYGRCRIKSETISAEYIEIANQQLYLLLSDLANQGVPLWCIEKQVYPLYEGVGNVTLDIGTVDVLNSNLRQLQEVTGTNVDTLTERVISFATATEVTTVGIQWSAASVPVVLARSDDGIIWETIQTETVDASAGEWSWFDLSSVVAARYLRVQALNGSLGFSRIFTGNNPNEITLYRMNRDDWTALPNKAFLSNRPLQFWFDRQVNQPVMRFWPIPNAAAETSQIVLWRHRYIMDVGSMTQEIEVPQRWHQAIVSMLAARLALETAEVDAGLIPLLDGKAEKDLYVAQLEEQDNSPWNLVPDFSAYTR